MSYLNNELQVNIKIINLTATLSVLSSMIIANKIL